MITGNQVPSLMEAYSAVYDDDLRTQIEEQNQINDFLTLIEALVEEGYDLSEYTYDELYENYISENVAGAFRGALGLLRGSGKALAAGARPAAKGLLASTGKFAVEKGVPIGIAALIDQWLTGGKGREYVGAGINKAREALHNIPSPGEAGRGLNKLGQDVKAFFQKPKSPQPSSSGETSSGNPLGLKKEDYDVYNVIAGYLIDEGYVDNAESAFAIVENMSEDWRQSIVEEVLDERNRGERGMSDREVRRRRNLGLRDPRMSSSAFGDHGPQGAIQRFHRIRGKKRTAEHKAERNTRGDLGRVSGTGPASRYQSNDEEGYPSIRGNDGPF